MSSLHAAYSMTGEERPGACDRRENLSGFAAFLGSPGMLRRATRSHGSSFNDASVVWLS